MILKRYILHFEWNRKYRWLPAIYITPMIKHGQRGTDGGELGTFIVCKNCSGAGTLFEPDKRRPRYLGEQQFLRCLGETPFLQDNEEKLVVASSPTNTKPRRPRYLGEKEFLLSSGSPDYEEGDTFVWGNDRYKVTYSEPRLVYAVRAE